MIQVNSTVSPPPLAPVSTSSIRTTAPQVVCVTSFATMPAFAPGSALTSFARLPAASSHSPPVQINLQTYLAALQQAARHLQPAPLTAVSSAPCSSSTPFSLASSSASSSSPAGASSTHSAASTSPSSLPGASLSFPSFIPTVCAALGGPFGSSAFLAGSTTPTPSVIAPTFSSAAPLSVGASSIAPSSLYIAPSRSARPGFDAGPGRPPIPPKLVEKIRLGEYIDFAELLPDSLRDNELPRELMLEHQHLVIPKRPPRREVRDIISWIDCWIAYCQVVLTFSPSRSVELLKYLDLIVRTHRSFPSADVWLRYDRGFRRKAACSPVPLDWGSTDLEVFHQPYASSNVLQPAALSSQSFRRSGGLSLRCRNLPHLEQGSLHERFRILQAPPRVFLLSRASPLHHVPQPLPPPPLPFPLPLTSSRAGPLTNRRRELLLFLLRSRYLWLVAVCRPVLRHFLAPGLLQLFCARPCLPWP